ncbi:hypothetical protein DM02DRAFT_651292 [Periconia macrospinosa]|uniref:Nephrocystin 3-like N-terminal domain-containing protein n=1 Tax=Periconia macrospinosa TaxID=97972 RepID=A0A2V1E5B2_9PLEO|nr:hypothetical protein DM02DRAFT_651292 [Periconia macrospinosa]
MKAFLNGYGSTKSIKTGHHRKNPEFSISKENQEVAKVRLRNISRATWYNDEIPNSIEDGLQKNHQIMLQSILYQFLGKGETFFYNGFQFQYRSQQQLGSVTHWDYASLKTLFRSLEDFPLNRRIYIVIDSVDESDESNRREILELFVKVCGHAKRSVIKVFVASRPVGQLEVHKAQIQNLIVLQNETKHDIDNVTNAFLDRLMLWRVHTKAKKHIVVNAEGVFYGWS